MKKLLFLLLGIFTLQAAQADDKLVAFEQLPAPAQTFVKKYFPKHTVAFAKVDKEIFGTSYEVTFANGDEVEFDKKGEWTDLKCKHGGVPEAAVPAQIKSYVKQNHADAKVIELERDRYSYEVKLSNFWEIKFDKQFSVIDMDFDD